MNWYNFHYNKEGKKRHLYRLREAFWKVYLHWYNFYKIRFERCPKCNKRLINRGENLGYDLYMEQRNCTWCKKCSKEVRLNGK